MAWDIYGERLERGHCEVHPHVGEEYPCSLCLNESSKRQQEGQMARDYQRHMEAEYIKAMEADYIASLQGTDGDGI